MERSDILDITLKQASTYDCELLFNWANDDEVRKNSFNSDKILYEDHVKWFNSKLNSNECFIFILKQKDISIGQVRINIESKVAIISYSIDKKYRGKGLAVVILKLLEEKIKNKCIDINKLVGFVKFDNIASQKAFESLKYSKKIHSKFLEYKKYLA